MNKEGLRRAPRVHLMEGDLPNARYWFRKAGRPFSDDIPAEIAALSESLKR